MLIVAQMPVVSLRTEIADNVHARLHQYRHRWRKPYGLPCNPAEGIHPPAFRIATIRLKSALFEAARPDAVLINNAVTVFSKYGIVFRRMIAPPGLTMRVGIAHQF